MSNSSLVNFTLISPHRNIPRNNQIRKITIHHMAGNLSVENCGRVFQSREASANYGVGSDGRVGLYVEEKDRSWASSSPDNDNQAVTIEVANDGGAPDRHVSDVALQKTIELCVDICRRNGIAQLNYTGDATGNLTRHNMFAATTCPGPYLQSKFPYIAESVNAILNGGVAPSPEPAKAGVITYQVWSDVYKRWLPNVVGDSDYAGIFGHDVDCVYADVTGGNIYYRVSMLGGGWLSEVKNRGDYAGVYNMPIDAFAARIDLKDKVLHYKAHSYGVGWLPEVTGYDINDDEYGYAGIKGRPIDAIMMWLTDKPTAEEPKPEPVTQEPTPQEPMPEPDPVITEPVTEEPVIEDPPEDEPGFYIPEPEPADDNVTPVTDTEEGEEMKKINWKQKLTSRKMWMALASFVSMLILTCGGAEKTATQVTALIVAGASVIAYIAGEGLIDAARNSGSEDDKD